MAFALSDAKQYLKDRDFEDGSTLAIRKQIKIANEASKRLRMLGKFDFDKRWYDFAFAGVYSTGTVSVDAGGTAVTGSGTVWTAAMTGSFIRFNGETLQYAFTRTGATTGTIPAYKGLSNLSGVSYTITDDRKQAPTGFRDLAWPITDNQAVPRMFPKSMEEIRAYRRLFQITQYPWYYGVEVEDVSSVPTPYINIYPSVASQVVVTIPYYKWNSELTADADVFGIPVEAETTLELFLAAILAREQGEKGWQSKMSDAESEGMRALGAFRYVAEDAQREIWTPEADKQAWNIFSTTFPGFAPGEPIYTGT